MRRTTDEFLELIEIKTPLEGRPLFQYDSSHDCYYQSAELSKVIGQVLKYIEVIDAKHDDLLANDQLETRKIRAKIIIGRSRNENQVKALRRLNGHLHRVEVITFDQLAHIAQRVMSYLNHVLHPIAPTD